MASRSIYRGQKRKLVLAFDVGTTFSGISYRFETNSVLLVDYLTGACLILSLIIAFWIQDKSLKSNL
jgi:hypothetical protein